MAFGIFIPTMRRKRSGGTLPLISKIRCGGAGGNIALGVDGTIWGWGGPGSVLGMGLNTPNPYIKPSQIGTDTDWVDITTSGYVHLAIKSNGTLWVWGQGAANLGLGVTTTTAVYAPTQIGSDTNWMRLPKGIYGGSAALKTDNSLYCWGNNSNGTLFGVGSIGAQVTTPVKVTGGSMTWGDVSMGNVHSIAITPSGNIYSCGSNNYGQCGHSSGFGSSSAMQPVTFIGSTTTLTDSIFAGSGVTFLRNLVGSQSQSFGNRSVMGAGGGSNTYVKTNITNGLNFTKIIAAGSSASAFALDSSGNIFRWGSSSFTTFGGTTTNVPVNTGETDISISDISMGNAWLMVLKNDGSLWSRGLNATGTLGDNTQNFSSTLIRIN